MNGDAGSNMAVADVTFIIIAGDAATMAKPLNSAVVKCQVLHLGTSVAGRYSSKEALVIFSVLIDVDAADGVALAIEVSGETFVFVLVADGYEVVLRAIVCDVVRQHKVCVFVHRASVYLAGQQVKVIGGCNLVRVGLRAVSTSKSTGCTRCSRSELQCGKKCK